MSSCNLRRNYFWGINSHRHLLLCNMKQHATQDCEKCAHNLSTVSRNNDSKINAIIGGAERRRSWCNHFNGGDDEVMLCRETNKKHRSCTPCGDIMPIYTHERDLVTSVRDKSPRLILTGFPNNLFWVSGQRIFLYTKSSCRRRSRTKVNLISLQRTGVWCLCRRYKGSII